MTICVIKVAKDHSIFLSAGQIGQAGQGGQAGQVGQGGQAGQVKKGCKDCKKCKTASNMIFMLVSGQVFCPPVMCSYKGNINP